MIPEAQVTEDPATTADPLDDPWDSGAAESGAAAEHGHLHAGGEVFLSYATPEALFRANYTRLVRALALAWGGDTESAADAVQEAFAQLIVHWDRVSTYDDPAAWVRHVAVNNLRARHRSLLRRARALLRLAGDAETSAPPPNPPDDLTARLRALPERQRTATALHYVGGLTVNDVARAMKISPGSVNQHLHRARAALRTTMEAER
ncbi:MAG: RNA polymerase sigma factor [Thermoleophilia bacterium]